MKTFSIKKTITEGILVLRTNFLAIVGIVTAYSAVIFMLSYLSEYIQNAVQDAAPVTTITVFTITIAVQVLLSWFLVLGLMDVLLRLVRGEDVGPKNLFDAAHKFIRFAGAALAAGVLIILGFIALIIPGIYLALRYSQALYAVIDGKGSLQALKRSAELTEGVKFKLLGIFALLFLIQFFILASAALISVVTPAPQIVFALFALFSSIILAPFSPLIYQNLLKRKEVPPQV